MVETLDKEDGAEQEPPVVIQAKGQMLTCAVTMFEGSLLKASKLVGMQKKKSIGKATQEWAGRTKKFKLKGAEMASIKDHVLTQLQSFMD